MLIADTLSSSSALSMMPPYYYADFPPPLILLFFRSSPLRHIFVELRSSLIILPPLSITPSSR
jgi:hypothetical protein